MEILTFHTSFGWSKINAVISLAESSVEGRKVQNFHWIEDAPESQNKLKGSQKSTRNCQSLCVLKNSKKSKPFDLLLIIMRCLKPKYIFPNDTLRIDHCDGASASSSNPLLGRMPFFNTVIQYMK